MRDGTKQLGIGFGMVGLAVFAVPLVWWFGFMRRMLPGAGMGDGAPADVESFFGGMVVWAIVHNGVGMLLGVGGITMIVLGAARMSREGGQVSSAPKGQIRG